MRPKKTKAIRDAIRDFLGVMDAKDEAPSEIVSAAAEMADSVNDALEEIEKTADEETVVEGTEEETKDEALGMEETKDEALGMEEIIEKVLRKHGLLKDESLSELESLADELGCSTEDESNEEAVTVEAETMNDSAVRKIVSEVKPAIASVKDAKARKMISDSVARLARMNMETTPQYNEIMRTVTSNQAARDAKLKERAMLVDENYGLEMAKRYNATYKEEK